MTNLARGKVGGVGGHWAAACALVGLLACQGVAADQWFVEPSAKLEAFYDDNVRLSAARPQSSFAGLARALVKAGLSTEVTRVGLRADLSARRYSQVAELDRTDGAVGLMAKRQLERHRVGLDASFDYDSTLTSEVQTSGLVQVNKRRSKWFVSPSWEYSLSPRAQLDLVLSYQDVTYEDVELIPLFDYRFARAGLTASYTLSERTQVFGRLSYDQYEAEQVKTESDNFGLEAGASYLLSETMSILAYTGVRHSKAEIPTLRGVEETDNTGPLFELRLSKRFETGELQLTADRSLLPSSNGTLLDTTGLSLSLDYRLSPAWRFRISAAGYRNRNPDGEVSRNDRDYLAVAPGLERRLSDSLRLGLSYRYRWQSYEVDRDDAVSNAVFLTLNYAAPREPIGSRILQD